MEKFRSSALNRKLRRIIITIIIKHQHTYKVMENTQHQSIYDHLTCKTFSSPQEVIFN